MSSRLLVLGHFDNPPHFLWFLQIWMNAASTAETASRCAWTRPEATRAAAGRGSRWTGTTRRAEVRPTRVLNACMHARSSNLAHAPTQYARVVIVNVVSSFSRTCTRIHTHHRRITARTSYYIHCCVDVDFTYTRYPRKRTTNALPQARPTHARTHAPPSHYSTHVLLHWLCCRRRFYLHTRTTHTRATNTTARRVMIATVVLTLIQIPRANTQAQGAHTRASSKPVTGRHRVLVVCSCQRWVRYGASFNKLTMVCRCVDSYLPRFTSSHGQNVVDSQSAVEFFTTLFRRRQHRCVDSYLPRRINQSESEKLLSCGKTCSCCVGSCQRWVRYGAASVPAALSQLRRRLLLWMPQGLPDWGGQALLRR